MARQVVVALVDDFDAESVADETVAFTIDGVAYEMDLSASNAAQLRNVFAQWTAHARTIGRVQQGKSSKAKPARGKDQTAAIREWARQNGHKISRRGRISLNVVQAYEKASA
ncbi:histone-like nucleoid-structuring protein Lsr2 [Nocardia colli]|uniref:histone-like nucleoid-structuring protein Lsr2 n=1 Tax=Nocardia colli TaxID=2545717 RepID=UPI0035DEC4FE